MTRQSSSAFDIVALAASAGGLRALTSVLAPLPADFPIPVVIVQHLDPRQPSLLAPILSRRAQLKVKVAEADERPQPGVVYVAPPDRHLRLKPDRSFTLTQTEPVHFVRPSADQLFESIADSYHAGAIAIVLTGTGRDGEAGVRAIKKAGGMVIAQDEGSSEFFGMPGTAIHTGCVDLVLALDKIPYALLRLVARDTDHEST